MAETEPAFFEDIREIVAKLVNLSDPDEVSIEFGQTVTDDGHRSIWIGWHMSMTCVGQQRATVRQAIRAVLPAGYQDCTVSVR